ncbi:MAG: histidinol dehydrogenase [Planctomycetota bacterium]|nr:MAG: histidinol dehydrogenase [Planctomycetota bacterium]
MIEVIKFNSDTKEKIIDRLISRTDHFYEQFSKPLEGNREIFGKPLTPLESVRQILGEIQKDGDIAVCKYSEIFDKVIPDPYLVGSAEIKNSYQLVNEEVVEALKVSIENVSAYQKRMLPNDISLEKNGNATTGAYYHPIERVGIYIPGGTAPLCSSVIMNALPAIIAGVPEVVVFTPPQRDGTVDPGVLVACDLIGIKEIYRVGGIPAIGMMAYGTSTFKKVCKIAGPGNSFVALAKKEVVGYVDIDLFAGPSEILILADETANKEFVAADMIAQAEHDKVASSILITTSIELAESLNEELDKQLEDLPRKEIASYSLKNYGFVIVVDNISDGITLSNLVAPEHLELCVDNPNQYLNDIKNTGAIFLGNYSPEAAGDYLAGPSHTLPTSGTGKFYSGVSADTFIRRTSIIHYDQIDFEKDSPLIASIAKIEQLEGHARSALIRLGKTI